MQGKTSELKPEADYTRCKTKQIKIKQQKRHMKYIQEKE